MAPCTHPGTSREVHEARLPRTCSRPCAFEVKKTKKKTKSHQTLKKHTTKYIHSSPATATTSRRRAVKHVPLGSPYSHSSSIDLGFVEIGLACIHTYVYTRTAAAAAPPVYVLVLYTIFWPAQLRLSLLWYSYVSPVSGLSGGAWHWAFRERMVSQDSTCTAAREASSAAAASYSREQRAAACGVRHNVQTGIKWSGNKITISCQSEHQKISPHPKHPRLKKHFFSSRNPM